MKVLNENELVAIVGGRERVVSKVDLNGDGRWDLKTVAVYDNDGNLVRFRTRTRRSSL